MSDVSSALQAAYLATHYQVRHSPQPFTLHIAQYSPELHALHLSHGVTCSAFLTAWNPFSELAAPEVNHGQQDALLGDLQRQGITCLSGMGVDPSAAWPGEESVLALGLTRNAAILLGQQYGQNAVVWIGHDAVPELILLK